MSHWKCVPLEVCPTGRCVLLQCVLGRCVPPGSVPLEVCPNGESGRIYILAALWGVGDAVWHPQLNALYGSTFVNDERAAFSTYKLWESLGFLFAFTTSASGVCILTKIVLMLFSLTLGMIGYLMFEFEQKKKPPNIKIV